MRSLSLRAAVATRMRLWDQIRRALRGPRQTQNLDLRPAHDPDHAEAACRKQHDRGPPGMLLDVAVLSSDGRAQSARPKPIGSGSTVARACLHVGIRDTCPNSAQLSGQAVLGT